MREDSLTVMYGGRTTDMKSALENMRDLFMKEDLSTVMFGRKTLDDPTTRRFVVLLQEDFNKKNKFYESFN